MTTQYKICKCKYLSFNKSIDTINKTDDTVILNGELDEMINKINECDKTKLITFIIDAKSPAFNDIVFKFDEDKKKLDSGNIKQDVMSGISLGSSNILDAIQLKEFAINPGRKTSGINSIHQNQNHDVIDALATNGLLYSPKIISEYSIGKILIEMNKLNSFKLYIIHPSLKADVFDGIAPCSYNVPRYNVGEGEILSVFFRYISLLYFGYMSVYDNDDLERNYDI